LVVKLMVSSTLVNVNVNVNVNVDCY